MTKQTHTPGPWMIHGKHGTTVYAHDYGTEVCSVSLSVLRGEDEYRANARLIAAAPEMLEVLESLAALCPSEEGLGGHAPIGAFIVCGERARAAISKARGNA